MDAPAVALSAVAGLLVGWFAVVAIVERIPEPSPLPRRAQVVTALVNGVLWAVDANKFTRWWAVVTFFVVFSTLLRIASCSPRLARPWYSS